MDRTDKILDLASESAFYRNKEGFYRIVYTCFGQDLPIDDDEEMSEEDKQEYFYFEVIEEDSGEEYRVYAYEVEDADVFYKTTEVSVHSLFMQEQLDVARKVANQDSDTLRKLADS